MFAWFSQRLAEKAGFQGVCFFNFWPKMHEGFWGVCVVFL